MILRETDMPAEKEWEKYFRPKRALETFGLRRGMKFLDLGCGYGTFSIPAARIVGKSGVVYSLDIDEIMVGRVRAKAKSRHLNNVKAVAGDVSSLRDSELPLVHLALLANVIHGASNKVRLLKGVKKFLKSNGHIVVMNWKVDESTPRGPPMKMRPTEKETLTYLQRAGYDPCKVLDMPPFHYAVIARRR